MPQISIVMPAQLFQELGNLLGMVRGKSSFEADEPSINGSDFIETLDAIGVQGQGKDAIRVAIIHGIHAVEVLEARLSGLSLEVQF